MSLRLWITIAIGMLLFLLLMTLFIYLIICKWKDLRYESRKQAWVDMLEQSDAALTAYLSEGTWSRLIIPRRLDHFEALEELFSHRLKLEQLTMEKQRIAQFADRYFVPLYRRRLQNGRWSERMNTLLYIEMFQMKVLQDELVVLLRSEHCTEQEKYLIYRILAGFHYEGTKPLLEGEADRIPGHVVRQMLYPLPYSFLEPYVVNFEECPPLLQEHILDVLRMRHERTEELLLLLERLLESEHRELRIRSLKGLAAFGYMTDEALAGLSRNIERWRQRHWPERLMLARLMGAVRDESFMTLLESFMGDESYLVRSEAAASISMYRGGRDRLMVISMHHADKYAREMAAERLELG